MEILFILGLIVVQQHTECVDRTALLLLLFICFLNLFIYLFCAWFLILAPFSGQAFNLTSPLKTLLEKVHSSSRPDPCPETSPFKS